MAGIPPDIIDDVRGRANIVDVIGAYVELKHRGDDHWGCCPFHKEKTPSFKVSASRQAFYCFGCQKSGNVFTFLMEHNNLDFPSAVRELAHRVGVSIPERTSGGERLADGETSQRDRVLAVLDAVTKWYQNQLWSDAGEIGQRYLQERGIPQKIAQDFQLGYSPDAWDACLRWGERREFGTDLLIAAGLVVVRDDQPDGRCYDRFRGRLMFPIHDTLGRVVGFSARTLDKDSKTAKYINTPETAVFHKSSLLYSLHLARKPFREAGFALVCEGQIDVIACHRAGLANAVAPQGTAFTEEQARMLKRFTGNVTFAFDADAAGQKAAVRSVELALAADLQPRVAMMPEGEDPDSVLRGEGADGLRGIVEASCDAFEFLLARACQENDPGTPAGQTGIVRFLLPALVSIEDPVQRAAQAQWISSQLRLPESAVFDAIKQHVNRERRRQFAPAEPYPPFPDAPPPEDVPDTQQTLFATPVAKAEECLLDLALYHGFIAHQLVEELPHDTISETPVGQALNMVLGMTAQGEWADAAQELVGHHELSATPIVGRILANSVFPKLEEEEESYVAGDSDHVAQSLQSPEGRRHERERIEGVLEQAMRDCLGCIRSRSRTRTVAELERAILAEQDPDRANDLMRQYQALMKEKHNLT